MPPKLRFGLLGLGIFFVVLTLFVVLTFIVKDELARARFESKLDDIHAMTGKVGSADFDMFDRRLVFENIVLERENSADDEPLVTIDRLEVEVFGSMLSSDSTAELTVTGANVYVARSAPALSEQTRADIKALSVWDTDRVSFADVALTYVDASLPVSLDLAELHGRLSNLAAAQDPDRREPMRFVGAGELEGAKLELEGSTQLGVSPATFDLHGSLVGFPLVRISNLIEARMSVEVKAGYLALGVELHGQDGKLDGHFAPHFARLELEGDEDGAAGSSLRAFITEIAADKVDDPKNKDKNSARLEFVGRYGGEQGWSLEAVEERNSWLQEQVLKRSSDAK